MSEKHADFIRSIPHVFATPIAIRDSLYAAADYIDELEGQVKLLNKLGNLDSTNDGILERIAVLEDRINRSVTHMDLEQAVLQMRAEITRRERN